MQGTQLLVLVPDSKNAEPPPPGFYKNVAALAAENTVEESHGRPAEGGGATVVAILSRGYLALHTYPKNFISLAIYVRDVLSKKQTSAIKTYVRAVFATDEIEVQCMGEHDDD
jgi:S-adenosylmethionine/arginine decarboxylase-like enzyme